MKNPQARNSAVAPSAGTRSETNNVDFNDEACKYQWLYF